MYYEEYNNIMSKYSHIMSNGKVEIRSLKMNENYQIPLFEMYRYTAKHSHLNDEELKEYFCSELIPFFRTSPKVSTILKFKGTLRISWSFDVKYDKNIDLIFFPEDNPYINYAMLFAKDFKKTFDKDVPYYKDRSIASVDIPYNINYDFVKTILSQSPLSKAQQERFFQLRFGSVFVNMEIEFEWYFLDAVFEYLLNMIMVAPKHNGDISHFSVLRYDSSSLRGDDEEQRTAEVCLGIIKSYKVLPDNIAIEFSPYIASWRDSEYNRQTKSYESVIKHLTYTQILTPLPTAALAITKTNINDFIVNVRDKPSTKDGKIISQLLAQETKAPLDIYIKMGNGTILNPSYQKMVDLGKEWFEKDIPDYDAGKIGYVLYYDKKSKQAYLNKEKRKLINALHSNEYLVLVWNIEANNWAKVWILKMIRDNDSAIIDDEEVLFKDCKDRILKKHTNFIGIIDTFDKFINHSYTQTFNQSPSNLKLYEGYIHTSGLEYLMPFTQNYIKR